MEIFKVMSGLPVIVRLLDPPLNEFLPKEHEVTKKLDLLRAEGKGESDEAKKLELLLKRAEALKESNPMLGFRGCRVGVLYPEIYEAQVKAISEAACELVKQGIDVNVKILGSFSGNRARDVYASANIEKVVAETAGSFGMNLHCKIGTID